MQGGVFYSGEIMKKPDRFERVLDDEMDGYQWNARKRKSPINLKAIALKLLRAEHQWVENTVQVMMTERIRDYDKDVRNTKLSREMRAINAGRIWAIKDLRDEIVNKLKARAR